MSEPTETSKPSITFRPTRFGGVDYVPVDCGFDTPERMTNLVRHLVVEPVIDAPTAAAMVVWMCHENVGKAGTLETFKAAIVGAWAACGGWAMTEPTETSIKPGDTVFVTKYALTVGILVRVVDSVSDGGRYAYSKPLTAFSSTQQWCRGEFHATEEAAQARVREMCEAKLKSLRKQVAKVEAIATNGAKVKR